MNDSAKGWIAPLLLLTTKIGEEEEEEEKNDGCRCWLASEGSPLLLVAAAVARIMVRRGRFSHTRADEKGRPEVCQQKSLSAIFRVLSLPLYLSLSATVSLSLSPSLTHIHSFIGVKAGTLHRLWMISSSPCLWILA